LLRFCLLDKVIITYFLTEDFSPPSGTIAISLIPGKFSENQAHHLETFDPKTQAKK